MKKLFRTMMLLAMISTLLLSCTSSVFAHKSKSWGVYQQKIVDGVNEYVFVGNELIDIMGRTTTKESVIDDISKSINAKQYALNIVTKKQDTSKDNYNYYINCYKNNPCYTKRCANSDDAPDASYGGYCPNSHGFPTEGLNRAKGTFYQNYVYEYWRLENEIYKAVNGTDVPQIVDFFKAENINMNVPIPLRELPCNYTGYVGNHHNEVVGEPYTGDDGITRGFAEQVITPVATPTPTPVPTTPPKAVERINSIKREQNVENTLYVFDTDGVLTLAVNGEIVKFPDVQPFIDNHGRTQIPVRALAETFNCDVNWDGRISTAIINGNGKLITIAIDSTVITVNGVDTVMDTTAMLKDERTCVPIRYIAEALGLTVKYEKV